MKRSAEQLRRDALAIWRAGVDAVASDQLVRRAVRVERDRLLVGDESFELATLGRIAVIGAGKAGAGMAAGLEQSLGPQLMQQTQLAGWVNVPENCVRPLERIHLHGARPAGVNEPTDAGAQGSREIMRLVEALGPNDLCIALISGGGSALLPLPLEGITLADKLAVTRFLSAAGAPIEELNTVRKQLSQIKGGKLARACRAGRLITLVISDILGDPLDLIASGPTVESKTTPAQALTILERYGAREHGISDRVFAALKEQPVATSNSDCRATNFIIGNNATAVEASRQRAEQLGYRAESVSAKASEGTAETVGRDLAERALEMCAGTGPDCYLSGGEPVVKLVSEGQRGLGGRNQQLVLAAVERLNATAGQGVLILSGGTDGEDGPTDAAGAFADDTLRAEAARRKLDPADYLARNDAYHWFEPLGGLIKTGPTDTNVCDVRVVLVERDTKKT